jgi:hypothetical protein
MGAFHMSQKQPSNERGLAYHLGVFAFFLGRTYERPQESERSREDKPKANGEQKHAQQSRHARPQPHWLNGALEYHFGAFAFLLGPKAWRKEAIKQADARARHRQTERQHRAEQQRFEQARMKAEQEREAERQRRERERGQSNSLGSDWWHVLELSPAADVEEIRRAYRQKIKQYHPDRVTGLAPEFLELVERRTQALNDAYAQALRSRRPTASAMWN